MGHAPKKKNDFENGFTKPDRVPLGVAAKIVLTQDAGYLGRMLTHRVTNVKRIASLPTLEEIFARKNDQRALRILADNNLEVETIEQIRKRGFNVADVKQARLCDAEDERLYVKAWDLKAIIVTNDRGFMNRERFDLLKSPGVVVLPKVAHGPNDFIHNPQLKAAIRHLADVMPRRLSAWRKHVVRYTPEGILVVHDSPVTRSGRGIILPTVRHVQYFPKA